MMRGRIVRKEERLVLALCRSDVPAADVQSLLACGDLDWNFFLSTIARHQVEATVLSRLVGFPLPERARFSLLARAREAVAAAMRSRHVITSELDRIGDAFRETNIGFVLMKGISLDASGLRDTGDLDLLVRDDDLLDAVSVLRTLGYAYVGAERDPFLNPRERTRLELQLPWNNQYEMYHPEHRLLVELHTNLFQRRRAYRENLDPLLDRIDRFREAGRYDEAIGARVFSAEHLLLLMCLHNALKRAPYRRAFILRTLIDIESLAGKIEDWNGFADAAVRFGVAPFVFFSLTMARDLLSAPVPPAALGELRRNCSRAQRLLMKLHLGCLVTLNRFSMLHCKLYETLIPVVFGRSRWDRIGGLLLVPILFPPKWRMAMFFRIHRDSPLIWLTYPLNPLRWMLLLARSLVRGGAAPARSAEEETVARDR